MKIVQIKGANGAGKSTIPLQMLECSENVVYNGPNTVLVDLGWVLIGPYGKSKSPTSNGCDNLGKVQAMKDAIHHAIANHPECDILFEGMMISTIKSTFYEFLMDMRPEVEPVFVILDVTTEGCLARLDARGTRKASLKIDNIRKKCEGVARHAKTYDQEYVRWLDVENTEWTDMLRVFLDLTHGKGYYLPHQRQYKSYMDIVRMSDSEVYEQLVYIIDPGDVLDMDRGQMRRMLATHLVEPLEIDRSHCPQLDIHGPWVGGSNESPFECLYSNEVGYITGTGNELSLLVQMHVMDRKDVPLMTEFEQVMSCGDCKGSRGGCPGYAPRFDTLKPSLPYFALLTISMDMAWALKYGSRLNAYMSTSWADIITQAYTRRIIGKFNRVGYTLGLGACPGCRRNHCSVLQGERCCKPKFRHYSCEATGVDCDWLHYMLYGEWMPWLYKGHAKVPYYTTRYAGVLVRDPYECVSMADIVRGAVSDDKSYTQNVPGPPDYPLERFTIPSGVHQGCEQYVYDLEVTE